LKFNHQSLISIDFNFNLKLNHHVTDEVHAQTCAGLGLPATHPTATLHIEHAGPGNLPNARAGTEAGGSRRRRRRRSSSSRWR